MYQAPIALAQFIEAQAPSYDAREVAPSTYQELEQARTLARLPIWSGASARTIWPSARHNFAFRAWHDAAHLFGRFAFDLAGETAACDFQCREMLARIGDNATSRHWCDILRAEIIGQAMHLAAHGDFPSDQAAFVEGYLACAKR